MRITGKTHVMFILGDPVAHIVGTDIVNRAFQARGVDLACTPLKVPPGALARALVTLRDIGNVVGFGCTIPHKAAVASLVDELTPEAAEVGAVNYVRRNPDGSLTGHNIDGAGFMAGLAAHGVDIRGKRVLQVGAGGVARPIAFSVAQGGAAEIVIANRDRRRAEALAEAVALVVPAARVRGCGLDDMPPPEEFGLAINCTSLGMHDGDALPFDPARLTPDTIVAEVIMTPPVTPLMAAATARGCKVVPGRAMMDPQPALVAAFFGL